MTSPGIANLDITVTKDSRVRWLSEGGSLQFRGEMFNVTNRPDFGNPNTNNPNNNIFNNTGGLKSTVGHNHHYQSELPPAPVRIKGHFLNTPASSRIFDGSTEAAPPGSRSFFVIAPPPKHLAGTTSTSFLLD
jgi:hypothetical protein